MKIAFSTTGLSIVKTWKSSLYFYIIITTSWSYILCVVVTLCPFFLQFLQQEMQLKKNDCSIYCLYIIPVPPGAVVSDANWRNPNRSCNLHHELDHSQAAPAFSMQKHEVENQQSSTNYHLTGINAYFERRAIDNVLHFTWRQHHGFALTKDWVAH